MRRSPNAIVCSLMLAGIVTALQGDMNRVAAQQKRSGHIVVTSVEPAFAGSDNARSLVRRYGLRQRDYASILAYSENVSAVVPVRIDQREARRGVHTANVQVLGTTSDFLRVTGRRVVRGRFLARRDAKTRNNVAVLGNEAAARLFFDIEPVGKTIHIGGESYLVIGRLAAVPVPKAQPQPRGRKKAKPPADPNLNVYIPLRTMRARQHPGGLTIKRSAGSFRAEQVELHRIRVTVKDRKETAATAAAIRRLLERTHKHEDYFIKIVN